MKAPIRRRAGLTLVELVLALSMTASLAAAIGYGVLATVDHRRVRARRLASADRSAAVEGAIAQMLEGAALTSDPSDALTYFVGAAETFGDTGEMGCDSLTFTTVAGGPGSRSLESDRDFEEQHRSYGPVGGVAEVALSLTPLGDMDRRSGLFLRTQRPADGDVTQGGRQRLLSAEIARIGFRFWDGLEWLDTWDTRTGERRLPAAVFVSYRLQGDSDRTLRTFLVAIPASDVDADDPATGADS